MFQPGEIVHAAFPFTDLSSSKRRPCLVLARCGSPDDFIFAFITSAAGSPGAAHAIAVNPVHPEWGRTGLKKPSSIRVDKLTRLHLSVISGLIGVLPDDLMASVRGRLRDLLDLNLPPPG